MHLGLFANLFYSFSCVSFTCSCNCNSPDVYLYACSAALTPIQKKSTSRPVTDFTSAKAHKPLNEVKEDKNGDDNDATGEVDVQMSEAAPDASSLDTRIGETPSDTDQNKINEKNVKEETEPLPDEKADAKTVGGKRKLQMQGRWRGVDPVIFYKDETVVGKITEFYGIKESLPIEGHLITRNDDMSHVKRIYYVSNSVKEALELNLLGGQQLKIAAVGLKMFVSNHVLSLCYCTFVL